MSARLATLRRIDARRRAVDQVIRDADSRIATVTAVLVHHIDAERDDVEIFADVTAHDGDGKLVFLPAAAEVRVADALSAEVTLSTERPVVWTVGVRGRPGFPRLDGRLPGRDQHLDPANESGSVTSA